jgi:hypothetical protein
VGQRVPNFHKEPNTPAADPSGTSRFHSIHSASSAACAASTASMSATRSLGRLIGCDMSNVIAIHQAYR